MIELRPVGFQIGVQHRVAGAADQDEAEAKDKAKAEQDRMKLEREKLSGNYHIVEIAATEDQKAATKMIGPYEDVRYRLPWTTVWIFTPRLLNNFV